jgi:hypothetical protein
VSRIGQHFAANHRSVPESVADRRPWAPLLLLSLAQFMVVLDVTVVNVALPSIGADLDFARGDLQWVVTAYVLFTGGLLLLGGRISDLLGRRRVFLVGLTIFRLPADPRREHSTEQHPGGRSGAGDRAPGRQGGAQLRPAVCRGDDRERGGREQGGPESLGGACRDQRAGRARQPAGQRRRGESSCVSRPARTRMRISSTASRSCRPSIRKQ